MNETKGSERRTQDRHSVRIEVNYRHDDTYLFTRSRSDNLSEHGIFLVAEDALPVGSRITLQFSHAGEAEPTSVDGEVVWVKETSRGRTLGMGIRFVNPAVEVRRRVQTLIRTMAYLD